MILKGEKVVLRPLRVPDAPRYVKWFNDPAVNKFLAVRRLGLAYERKKIRDMSKEKDRVNLAIEVDGVHIGGTSFEINKQNHRASWGIIIGDKRYWEKGYGYDAARTILDFAFKKYRLHRIELDVYDYNPRAQGLYRKLGFKFEGTKRQHNFFSGRYHDVHIMGLLASDWRRRT